MVAPRTTVKLIRAYIADGRGLGHGELYRAFIQLMRWNASPVSVQTVGCVPPFRRRMHFLSRSEWLLGLLLAWIGCHVREQVPLWPWRARHPLYGYSKDVDDRLGWSDGTIALCSRLGVKHGTYVGTQIPYIWTIDLLATLAWLPAEQVTSTMVSVKPLKGELYTGDIDPIARGPEKLEVERQFALQLGIPYFVADRSLFPGDLLGQLELYSTAAFIPSHHRLTSVLATFLSEHGHALPSVPPIEWRDRLLADYHLRQDEADLAVHHILWHQYVDVDLRRELQMEDIVRPGGRALQAALRQAVQVKQ